MVTVKKPGAYEPAVPLTTAPRVGVRGGEIVVIGLIGSGPSLDAATARRLAHALLDAADELDGPVAS